MKHLIERLEKLGEDAESSMKTAASLWYTASRSLERAQKATTQGKKDVALDNAGDALLFITTAIEHMVSRELADSVYRAAQAIGKAAKEMKKQE